jgi:hypothetical protein
VVVGAAALLWMSVVLSRQQARIDWLIEESAILSAELREARLREAEPSRASEGRGAEAPDYIVGRPPQRRLHLAKR